jgi:predicted phage terminase large subunit-like protein
MIFLQELARRGHYRYFLEICNQRYIFAPFNIEIANCLSKFLKDLRGGKRPIIVIQAPPQHGKTDLASRYFPAFAFGMDPNLRIAGCSYGSDLAASINRDIQHIMLSNEYTDIFPHSSLLSIKKDRTAVANSDRFNIPNHDGYYICTGVGGPLTGKSVDLGIIDDPIKNMQEARSDTVKKTLENWYQSVFLTRLSRDSGQIIMATRWALDDLVGFIIEKNKDNENLKVLKFPAISEDSDGNGIALHQALHPLEQLQEQKKLMDGSSWVALYQQDPQLIGGNLVKTSWFKYYDILPRLRSLRIYADTAMSLKTMGDYSVMQLWGRGDGDDEGNLYLVDQLRGRWDADELLARAQAFYTKASSLQQGLWCNAFCVEAKANGIPLLQQLRNRGIPVLELEATKDKVLRTQDALPSIASGFIHLPRLADYLSDLLAELEAFPRGSHDDQVDAMTYAINDRLLAADWTEMLR